MFDRERKQDQIELAVDKLIEELLRLRLAQAQVEIGIGLADQRQELREQIGRDRRDGAEAQRSGKAAGELARAVHEVVDVGKHACSATGDFPATGREAHAVARALQKFQAERPFKVLHLHGERRLRHRALLGGGSEMPSLRHSTEISELLQSDHCRSIKLIATAM
jgi:hypothetical protein